MGDARPGSGALWSVACLAVLTAGGASGCATSAGNGRSDERTQPTVAAVVALPPTLTFGHAAEQGRAARRMGDALIDATGGHAILADELPGLEPARLAEGVRALGEDPARTLTFSVTAERADRIEPLLGGALGAVRGIRRYADYTVRVDVRRADAPGVIVMGSVQAYSTAFANAPDLDAAGNPQGLSVAIESAVKKALRAYAPTLIPGEPFPTLLEAPLRAADDPHGGSLVLAIDKLKKLEAVYPEVSADDLATLASSHARFLVLKPGRLAALGLQRGDLVSGLGGQPLGSRAAFARTLARGIPPALSIDRGRGHFLLGQAVVARRP